MEFKVGDRVEVIEHVTAETVDTFAKVSGDFNPIHMDDEYAKGTRFGQRIAHGMLSAAYISKALAMELGLGIYLSQTMKFLSPVHIGDTLKIQLKVLKFDDVRGTATVQTLVRKQDDKLCVKGEAVIMRASFIAKDSPDKSV